MDQAKDNTAKLLHKISNNTNLQLEPDTNNSPRSIPSTEILDKAKDKLKELQDTKYANIMSKTAMDIGKTNLIELDILTEGPPIASKTYTIPIKYCEFIDYDIKQLEKVGIISRSMSDWVGPILVVSKKEEQVDANTNASNNNNSKFNLRLCINYRKLNSRIQTACQIEVDGSVGKVISNCPCPI